MRKILTTIAAMLLVFAAWNTRADAPSTDFTYTTNSGIINIVSYTGTPAVVSIPATISALPVGTIGSNSFRTNMVITMVTIPSSVSSIGNTAFYYCGNVTNVTYLGTNITYGSGAFLGCYKLASVTTPNVLHPAGGGGGSAAPLTAAMIAAAGGLTNAAQFATAAQGLKADAASTNAQETAGATGVLVRAQAATDTTNIIAGVLATNVPTLQQVLNSGNEATNSIAIGPGLSATNISDASLGAVQFGVGNSGVHPWNRNYMAILGDYPYGSQAAFQQLCNNGYATIGPSSSGSHQHGANILNSTMIIGFSCIGASQDGQNYGTMVIGDMCDGSRQYGVNNGGTWVITNKAEGAAQIGYNFFGYATNCGWGAMQIFSLTNNQIAYTSGGLDPLDATGGGAGSLLIGAGVSSNRHALTVGDGAVSHGDGSITAGGGFYGSGAALTGITAAQIGAVSQASGVATNITLVGDTYIGPLIGTGRAIFRSDGTNLFFVTANSVTTNQITAN